MPGTPTLGAPLPFSSTSPAPPQPGPIITVGCGAAAEAPATGNQCATMLVPSNDVTVTSVARAAAGARRDAAASATTTDDTERRMGWHAIWPMDEPVRIDRWLWAARLARTRPLAAEAVSGGRVHVNGAAVKPSRDVRPGDEIEVTMGQVRRTVVVRGTAVRRGPAPEAQLLYEETPESIAERERRAQDRRLAAQAAPEPGGRPTKRDRRRLERTRRGRG